jgi:ABC-type transport system involved in multi-copper enzyme maturation permease subunit
MPAGLTLEVLAALAGMVALGLIVLVVGTWMACEMFQARSLFRRELAAYFFSPIAYVVLFVFLVVMGWLFYLTVNGLTAEGPDGIEYPMQGMLGNHGDAWAFWLVFIVIPPALTMRLLAEERGAGTLEMLLTAPLRDWQVVLSKYLACFVFYLLLWAPTLAYLPILLDLHVSDWNLVISAYTILLACGLGSTVLGVLILLPRLGTWSRLVALLLIVGGLACAGVGGWLHHRFDDEHIVTLTSGIDPMPVVSSYLGLALAGAMFLAIGIFVSSLTRSQIVAFLVSLVLCLVFVGEGFWRPNVDPGSLVYRELYLFSVPLHFDRTFTLGQVDTRPVVLYVSMTLFCLFLTVRSLESRRWR